MPAWNVTKLWTEQEIADYRAYVATEGPKLAAGGGVRCTCEDFAIKIVTDFAASNGLPVFFVNGVHDWPNGITPEFSSNFDDFLREVQRTTAAGDLANVVESVKGAADSESTSLRVARPGHLILLYNPISHTQVVTSGGSSVVKIAQGNFRPKGQRAGVIHRTESRINPFVNTIDQNDPKDDDYIGAIVAEKSYVLDSTSGKWLYDGEELFKEGPGRLRDWSFDGWNSRMIIYTVKNGDTFATIAESVYGRGVTPVGRISVIENVLSRGLGDSKGNPRPGSVLYLWR